MATSASIQAPVLPFAQQQQPQDEKAKVAQEAIAADHSLLEIDRELDFLFDRMQDELEETGDISAESKQAFDQFCEAFGEKVDRVGRFIRVMEARTVYCKSEAARLIARGKTAENKVDQTKSLILYYLQTRNMTKMEGKQFTLRCQKNPQDSVRVSDPDLLPIRLKRIEARFDGETWLRLLAAVTKDLQSVLNAAIQSMIPMNDAIKQAVAQKEKVEGATVIRGHHIRVV
ncbi:MAG TPA: siphovirus Gp157 family protein [Edaphobacter sp.]|uniref:siphovirus Gp157 family protein n=1 Tax=Edaphobacter sp. TaxID=1934404 RepID=UPI002CF9B6D9|nr:siphovirus Gp157 family protein [Edaphobacter sp.]HUZ96745.1 siphovirus Gp157 family protein [Edaphobacter sp.]